MMRWALIVLVMLLAGASPAQSQRTNPALLASSIQTAETVFDNGGAPWNFLAQINAENYDNGGQNVAFHQPNIGLPSCPAVPSAGQAYRPVDFVDLYASVDGVQFQVGCNIPGNYYKYQVNIPIGSTGPYILRLRVANTSPQAALSSWTAYIDNVSVGTVSGVQTANLNTFATLSIGGTSGFNATVGNHVLKLLAAGNTSNVPAGEISSFIAVPVGGVAVPPVAAAAGFTAVAANFDFSQTQYSTLSNWVDCANSDGTKIWHAGSPGISSIRCDPQHIRQVVDSLDGSTVMNIHYDVADNALGISGASNSVSVQTKFPASGAGTLTAGYPNWYVETMVRVTGPLNGSADLSGGPDAVWSWSENPPATARLEQDFVELETSANGYGCDGGVNWFNGTSSIASWCSFNGSGANLPSGYCSGPCPNSVAPGIMSYYKYSVLLTANPSNGNGSEEICFFVNDILQHCASTNVTDAGNYNLRHWLVMTVYDQTNPAPQNIDMYVKYIHVFSCPSWNNIQGDVAGSCNGTTFTTDANGVSYWH